MVDRINNFLNNELTTYKCPGCKRNIQVNKAATVGTLVCIECGKVFQASSKYLA